MFEHFDLAQSFLRFRGRPVRSERTSGFFREHNVSSADFFEHKFSVNVSKAYCK